MSRLFQARKSTITKPLNKNEIGYVFSSKFVSLLIDDIKKKKYGSYLIGGIVGTGKSSRVEIATNFAIKNPLIIHVKFSNREECINEFEKILMIELIKAIKEKEIDKESKVLSEIVESCEASLRYSVNETEQEENIREKGKKINKTQKESFGGKIGATLDRILNINIHGLSETEEEKGQNLSENKLYRNMVTRTKIQSTQLEYVYQLLDVLSNEDIIVIYDELDKIDEDILQILFAKYKTLFVEKDIFSFFVVNDIVYKKYSTSNLLQNPIYSYFMGIYYIPLLNFEEELRYSKMMFDEKHFISGLVTYYLCLGNYRIINQKYLSSYRNEKLDVVKAYVLIKAIEKMSLSYFDDFMRDMFIRKTKAAIETVIAVRNFQIIELAEEMKKEYEEAKIWPDYSLIICCIIEIMGNICPEAVIVNREIITIKGEEFINNYYFIEELIKDDRRESLSEDQKEMIQLSDMYSCKVRDCPANREIVLLSTEIIPLRVADNNSSSYREILVNLLYTNLMEKGIQVIVIRRAIGEESFYPNDFEYTGMVIVDKGSFEVAYYVNKGSTDSEKSEAIEALICEAKKLNINVAYLTATEHIDIDKDMGCIVGRYNNPFSELYEHRKVIYDKWA